MLQKWEKSAAKNNTALAAINTINPPPIRGGDYLLQQQQAALVESIRKLRLDAFETKRLTNDPVIKERAEGYMAALDDVRAILNPDEIRMEDIL